MGIDDITIIDFDKVEKHNIPNQFYKINNEGEKKVEALAKIVNEFSGNQINIIDTKIDDDTEIELDLDTIVITCLDSLEPRKLVFNKLKDCPIILIDPRMGGEEYQIYTIDLSKEENIRFYEKTLDVVPKEAPCGQKAIIYTILSIASEVCNIVKKINNNENYPRIIKRDLHTYRILSE